MAISLHVFMDEGIIKNSTQRKQKERRNDTIGFVFNSILSSCAHPRDLDNIFWTISKARILD